MRIDADLLAWLRNTGPGYSRESTKFSAGTCSPNSTTPAKPGLRLLKQRRHPCKHFRNDLDRHRFQPPRTPRTQINRAHLITTDHACSLQSGAGQRHCIPVLARKSSSGRNRSNDLRVCHAVKDVWRHDENRTNPLLLMVTGRVERDQVDVTPLQINSLPTGGDSSHSRSSSVRCNSGS